MNKNKFQLLTAKIIKDSAHYDDANDIAVAYFESMIE